MNLLIKVMNGCIVARSIVGWLIIGVGLSVLVNKDGDGEWLIVGGV